MKSVATQSAPSVRSVPNAGRTLSSKEVLAGSKEVLIVHRGEVYRLRETRNGKLLLGK